MTENSEVDSGQGREHQGRTRLPAAERRETIIRAAIEVFAAAGYQAARVSDVAARVGVTEPVIFQNFGSKAGLFAVVLDRAAADARASLDELAAGSGGAPALLAHVLGATGHLTPGHHPAAHPTSPFPGSSHLGAAYGVLFADAAALTAQPELTEATRVAISAVADHLADLIRHAKAREAVSGDVDPKAAAWLLLSLIAARRLRSAAMPGGLEPEVRALALRALTPRGS
jgi:AcrR family transcriptional regulator